MHKHTGRWKEAGISIQDIPLAHVQVTAISAFHMSADNCKGVYGHFHIPDIQIFGPFDEIDQINVMTVEPVYGVGQKLQLGSTDCVTKVGLCMGTLQL